jgi:hypothetical protein
MKRLTLSLILLAGTAQADEAALLAFVASFEAKDPAACEALFAPRARFIDLGNDFSARIPWFCQAVVDGNGQYTLLSQSTEGATTTFTADFQAGGYFAPLTGTLTTRAGKITDLVIERRTE